MSKLLLQDKVAIVTGAGRGLGEAIARAYAAEGAKVIVSDIDAEAARKIAASLQGASAVACDVRVPAQVEALVAAATQQHGRLDIMVANAGVAMLSPLVATSYEQWREVTSVNLDGVFLCIRYAAPALIAAGGGAIVTMASVTAKAACPLIGSYAAAKAGVVSLTQTAATELRAHNIRVNAILPAFIETDMVKPRKKEFEQMLGIPDFDAVIAQRQGRYGTPQEVANLAVFLASERASFSNGSPFVLDGGVSSSLL
ncbi:SDR family NAD(P)-dependent oxidoreductase [Variovorax ginsengisoli]|uniref:Glucose 1-dehydrogenase n=1 Tax=Variovorax ginsengisoli TaxID=363844 RepID=A0ABT8RW32_9BURK|nr:glucose 1-dehydrogenase [Variovorax ginsengisoli]MDN8611615.1 glucose 1-dehydrogenase [Variovorax ginsengisoli]MDO1530785.1 glucose 1-dehydrogenase [Variovorax ginsengisoli]